MGANSIHTNKGLFSDYYLDKILPFSDEKMWSSDKNLEIAFDKIRALYEEKQTELPKLNESQLEQFFIQPVLEILGHHTIVQPSEKTSEGIKRPDYALFDSKDVRDAALVYINEDWKLFDRAVGLCEAKKWDRSLDLSQLNQPTLFERRNPAYQMQQYLYYTEVKWGILTNGRIWRLYEREQSKRLDRYYQVDLIELISPAGSLFGKGMTSIDRLEAFKYFYFFFRAQAFPKFLDYVLAGSVDYAQAVGAELKDNAYKALRLLAQGFIDNKGNKLNSEKDKNVIRENCFVFLYRLLFILFAESKHLLPVDDSPAYKQNYSLHHIREEIISKRDKFLKYSKKTFTLWAKLESLFTLINHGEDTFRIPPYNGGLFDNDQHEFFTKYKVADWYIAEIINLLCTVKAEGRDRQSNRFEFIDYSSLEVRDLGSIYEGLLENRLEIATESMIAVRKGKQEKWKKEAERNEKDKVTDRVEVGQYYPVTQRGERKATGSYYTPDYIVEYIVEHTLGQLADRCKTEVELLALRVLDPAIGSGHFLVEATDFLARKLLGIKNVEETADEIGKAKRLVIERCIFGVDKNPLAVELAKLSLWLHTVAKDKPLSFLDHHLRCGDSLIGAKVAELGTLPDEENLPLFANMVARYSAKTIGFYRQIEEMPSDTLEQIHEKDRLLETARTQMLPFRRAADVWISTYFANKVEPTDYARVIEALQSGKQDAMKPFEEEEWFARADELWRKHRFFHWELEFPEVFFDTKGRQLDSPGFDAVIGNPPWGGSLDYAVNYLSQTYVNRSGEAESHLFFVEKGFKLISDKGRLGYITPNSWLAVINSIEIREYLLKETSFLEIKELSKYIFEDAPDIVPIILILGKQKEEVICRTSWPTVTKVTEENFDEVFVTNNVKQREWIENSDYSIIIRSTPETRNIKQKCISDSTQLGDLCDLFYGIKTGNNERFLSNKKTKSHQAKALKTGELTRYRIDWKGIFLWWCPELEGYKNFSLEVPKIVIQYIRKLSLPRRIVAALDTVGEFYPLNNYSYMLLKDSRYSLNYILGVLNSELINYYFTNTFVDYNIKPTYLKKLPIRTIDFSKPEDKAMHDQMVKLVEKMLDLHKRKQGIEKDYTGWLEHLLGAKLDDLTGKSKIANLQALDDINQLAELIKKNRKRTGFDTENPTRYTKLRQGFENFRDKLNPVIMKINEIDRQIDLLVYKLYGLTKKEIEIVEGKSN